ASPITSSVSLMKSSRGAPCRDLFQRVISLPSAVSQTRIKPSSPAAASRRPDGLNATLETSLLWPCRSFRTCPLAASQILTAVSADCTLKNPEKPAASQLPLGLKATLRNPLPELPGNLLTDWPETRSQIRILPSAEADASSGRRG